jgi:plasmid maintenance system killer protein
LIWYWIKQIIGLSSIWLNEMYCIIQNVEGKKNSCDVGISLL